MGDDEHPREPGAAALMSAYTQTIGGITLTFVPATGGWLAERDGFSGMAATRQAAVRDLERVIAQAEWEAGEAEREWSADLFYMQVDPACCVSAVEVASWD